VIRSAWRRIVRFLGSAGLATWLLAIVGAWSMVATIIPQGGASDPKIADWAATHPAIEPVVRAIGLHQAFTSLVFTACILALAVSTALCAWQRTKAALGKQRTLRRSERADVQSLGESHDLEITCDPALGESEVLSVASETLERLGIRTKRRGKTITAISPAWSVWGSPVFHWALLALIVTMLLGNLLRSEGLMGVAVGQTKTDAPGSYGVLHAGPLRDWSRVQRSIRVDAFDPDFRTGGIDRGPTPTLSLLDAAGEVVKTQLVYPNHTLKSGSLTIYPNNYGLSATLTLLNAAGVETGRQVQLVDFSEATTGGTVAADYVSVSDKVGKALLRVSVTVPLDRRGDVWVRGIPKNPTARLVVTSPDDKPVLDRVIRPGEELALPGGDTLRLDGIEYYARLSVVDDWTIPLLYVGLVAAMVGLTIAVVARQQIVLATVIEGPDGVKLAATVRLWRNASSSRSEIEGELAQALSEVEKGSTT
jgi:cytochrome c biogenesis protein ResB